MNETGHLVRSYATGALPYEADVLPPGELVAPAAEAQDDSAVVPGLQQRDLPVVTPMLAGVRHVVPLPY